MLEHAKMDVVLELGAAIDMHYSLDRGRYLPELLETPALLNRTTSRL